MSKEVRITAANSLRLGLPCFCSVLPRLLPSSQCAIKESYPRVLLLPFFTANIHTTTLAVPRTTLVVALG